MQLVRNASAALGTAGILVLAGCQQAEKPDDQVRAHPAQETVALPRMWESDAAASFLAMSGGIDAAIGASGRRGAGPHSAPALPAESPQPRDAAARHLRAVTALLGGPDDGTASPVLLPSEQLGTTWVWNQKRSRYVRSADAAPPDRIRFVLYERGDDGELVVPLVRDGHVDLIERSSGATDAVQVVVTRGDVAVLDYRLAVSGDSAAGRVDAFGYLSNGAERLSFDLRNRVSVEGNGAALDADVELEMGGRLVALTVRSGADGEPVLTADGQGTAESLELWTYGIATIEALSRPVGAFFAL